MRYAARLAYLLSAIGAVGCSSTGPADAQDAAAFYRNNTIRFIVGSATGGGYDTFARVLSPHLRKAIGANIVVENVPGAGGLVALNRIYAAQPDGLQIMIVNGVAAAFSQLLELDNVRYDLGKFEVLGIGNAEPWVWLVEPNSPYKTAASILESKAKLTWGGSGVISGMSDGAAMTCEALALDCKIVLGYKGSSDVALAVQRGEMDAMYVSDMPASNYVAAGSARAIASITRQRIPRFFPHLPTIFESVKLTPEQAWWLDFRITLDALGRILVTAPGVPADRVAYLQNAVKDVLHDPAVIAEAAKAKLFIDYSDPATSLNMIRRVVSSLTPEQNLRLKHVVTKKYY
jgi:tripartite-type tricarboxylate transporter receptor subunit TctC